MRKMPILTVVSLVALGLMVAPAYAGTLYGNDTPDIRLAPGTQADSVFDLDDFFDSESGSISYEAEGADVDADGVATVFGDADPGQLTATFTATSGDDSLSVQSTVQVTDFLIGNAPAIDNNNRLAGVEAGNLFVNGIAPGSSVSSSVALGNLPEPGADGTPGGVTGAAALIATIGQVSLDVAPTGLRQRSSEVVASGAGEVSAGGLTATLNADGTYSLAAGDDFEGAWIVTLGAQSGASADAAQLLAAAAVELDLAAEGDFIVQPPGTFDLSAPAFSETGIIVSAPQNQGALVIGPAVEVDGACTISLTYTSDSADVAVASLAFDGELGPSTVAYTNASGSNIDTTGPKNIALSMISQSGTVFPGFQVFNNGAAAASVTITSLSVIQAGPVVDYALNPNAVAMATHFPNIEGWTAFQQGADAPTAPEAGGENNFAAEGSGSMELNGADGFANGFMQGVAIGAGSIVGECYVQRDGDAGAGSAFALVITDGAINNMTTFVAGDQIATDGWTKVICSGTNNADSANFVGAQFAGFNGYVDDLSVRVVDDRDSYFDANLLGM